MLFSCMLLALWLKLLLSFTPALAASAITGYFPNWLYARYPVSSIDFTKYTHINYAFAILIKGATPEWTDPSQVETQLPQLVEAAHAKNAKVLISVGGWSGSITFSSMVADASQRATFIKWVIDQIDNYGIDGIDLDWEYPNRQGAGCNVVNPNDSENFLTLLKELRTALDAKGSKELTAAVHVRTFVDAKGDNMNDVSAYAAVLDRVNIMTYDINGAWNSTSGPNAPFNFQPGLGDADSFVSAIDNWIKAGMPAEKVSAGLAFYGRSATATVDMTNTDQYQPQVSGQAPQGDSFDAYWQDPYCAKDPGGLSGIWRYGNLRSQGILTAATKAASPWVRKWDNVTQTPWLFNPTSKVFISYDDPESIAVKVNHAKDKGIGGVMVWSIDQDSSDGELLAETYKFRSG
ncbi:glycoside hydrolase superfamily [Dichotomocladium elegans]|nr:glycoside hydrolase superfamily [Dichotomocladium elegans]